MEKIGYLNLNATMPTLFSFVDEKGEIHKFEFAIGSPKECIDTVSILIEQHGVTKVHCNKLAYTVHENIAQLLKTNYNYNNCSFDLTE